MYKGMSSHQLSDLLVSDQLKMLNKSSKATEELSLRFSETASPGGGSIDPEETYSRVKHGQSNNPFSNLCLSLRMGQTNSD